MGLELRVKPTSVEASLFVIIAFVTPLTQTDALESLLSGIDPEVKAELESRLNAMLFRMTLVVICPLILIAIVTLIRMKMTKDDRAEEK